MDDLQSTYKDDQNEDNTTTTVNLTPVIPDPQSQTTTTVDETLTIPTTTITTTTTTTTTSTTSATLDTDSDAPNFTKTVSSDGEEIEDHQQPPAKKHKNMTSLPHQQINQSSEEVAAAITTPMVTVDPPAEKQPNGNNNNNNNNNKKKKKKKLSGGSMKKKKSKGNNNVWTKPTSRKGKKRTKSTTNTTAAAAQTEDSVLITPIHRHPDKSDDFKDMKICLSKVYKAEKVELSEDRLSAGSGKGYRMVRATRGVMEGAWYFEIKVMNLGETGHTRLGWSTEKGDLQAPVGYDGNSYGYRDVDGSKVHKALREKYGEEGYVEGDVIGFYINLPDGNLYAPKAPQLVLYKGQKYAYATDPKDDPPKVVPGSEICFFRNGICQGSAFKDLHGGRYYPAASMYTLPNQSNCVVKFNFGPDFEAFPEDFGQRPIPKPMVEVPYHGFDGCVENGIPLVSTRMCPMLKVVKENEN